MIANIRKGSFIKGAIDYNEKKVASGVAAYLGCTNMCEGTEQTRAVFFTGQLAQLATLNTEVKKNVFHTSLNSPIGQVLTDEQWKATVSAYMDEMGFKDSPYAIYRHRDKEHDHVHIVSVNVDVEGKRINDAKDFEKGKKILGRIILENGFQPIVEKQRTKEKKEASESNLGIKSKMALSIENVLKNDIINLKDFSDRLDKQGIGIKTNQYQAKDKKGNAIEKVGVAFYEKAEGKQVGKAINGSSFMQKFTIPKIESYFSEKPLSIPIKTGKKISTTEMPTAVLKNIIQLELNKETSLSQFKEVLRSKGIEVITVANSSGIYGWKFKEIESGKEHKASEIDKLFSWNKVKNNFKEETIENQDIPTPISLVSQYVLNSAQNLIYNIELKHKAMELNSVKNMSPQLGEYLKEHPEQIERLEMGIKTDLIKLAGEEKESKYKLYKNHDGDIVLFKTEKLETLIIPPVLDKQLTAGEKEIISNIEDVQGAWVFKENWKNNEKGKEFPAIVYVDHETNTVESAHMDSVLYQKKFMEEMLTPEIKEKLISKQPVELKVESKEQREAKKTGVQLDPKTGDETVDALVLLFHPLKYIKEGKPPFSYKFEQREQGQEIISGEKKGSNLENKNGIDEKSAANIKLYEKHAYVEYLANADLLAKDLQRSLDSGLNHTILQADYKGQITKNHIGSYQDPISAAEYIERQLQGKNQEQIASRGGMSIYNTSELVLAMENLKGSKTITLETLEGQLEIIRHQQINAAKNLGEEKITIAQEKTISSKENANEKVSIGTVTEKNAQTVEAAKSTLELVVLIPLTEEQKAQIVQHEIGNDSGTKQVPLPELTKEQLAAIPDKINDFTLTQSDKYNLMVGVDIGDKDGVTTYRLSDDKLNIQKNSSYVIDNEIKETSVSVYNSEVDFGTQKIKGEREIVEIIAGGSDHNVLIDNDGSVNSSAGVAEETDDRKPEQGMELS